MVKNPTTSRKSIHNVNSMAGSIYRLVASSSNGFRNYEVAARRKAAFLSHGKKTRGYIYHVDIVTGGYSYISPWLW